MNPVFHIEPENLISSQTSLFAEVTNEGLSYFFLDGIYKKIIGLSVFHFDKKNAEINLSNVLKKIFDEQPLLVNNYKNVFISYAFNESVLTPETFYVSGENDENIDLIYGNLQQGTVITDRVEEKKLYNTYRIPQSVHETIINQFPAAGFAHQYTLLAKQLPGKGNLLSVIFYQNKFVVALLKNGKLQIIQAFNYATSEDVVYHMLNTCHRMEVKEVSVQLAGMIEKDSWLFQEIHKYFLNIHFSSLPAGLLYSEGIKELPNHFFSHLFSLALCV